MKISILTKLLVVIMILAIVPLAILGVLAISNISDMEDTAIGEVDDMREAVETDVDTAIESVSTAVGTATDAVSEKVTEVTTDVSQSVSDATATAVEDTTAALNALGVEFVYGKAADIAYQMRLYLEANPGLTQADLQGETYLIYESPEAQQEGAPPLYAGVHYGADNSEVLTLIGDWIITFGGEWNRFVDEEGNLIDLTGKFIVNASDGTAGMITSNTASTVSAAPFGPPGAVFDWDAGEDEFWAISVQNINKETGDEVENIGYAVMVDGGTGIPVAHPNPLVVGLPDHIGRSMFPLIYELMDKTIASGEPELGVFPFDEDNDPNTPDVERFAVFYPVKDASGEFITIIGPDPANPASLMPRPLMVSTAVVLKNFNAPALALEEKLQENATNIEAVLTASASEIESELSASATEIETELNAKAKTIDEQLGTNRDTVAAEISDAKDSTQTSTIIVIIVMVVIVAAVSFLFGRSVTNPIKKLTAAADKVSKGDMSVTIDVKSKDEIGELAESFDRMVTAVKFLSEDDD